MMDEMFANFRAGVFLAILCLITAFVILKTPHPVEVPTGPGWETCTEKGC